MFPMIDIATLPMTLGFLVAYACPAFAFRQTVHARIDTATRKRRLSATATEITEAGETDGTDTVMTAERNPLDKPSERDTKRRKP